MTPDDYSTNGALAAVPLDLRYASAVFMPIVGLLIGLALLAKRRSEQGIGVLLTAAVCMAISLMLL